jgi:hypothetical protein
MIIHPVTSLPNPRPRPLHCEKSGAFASRRHPSALVSNASLFSLQPGFHGTTACVAVWRNLNPSRPRPPTVHVGARAPQPSAEHSIISISPPRSAVDMCWPTRRNISRGHRTLRHLLATVASVVLPSRPPSRAHSRRACLQPSSSP